MEHFLHPLRRHQDFPAVRLGQLGLVVRAGQGFLERPRDRAGHQLRALPAIPEAPAVPAAREVLAALAAQEGLAALELRAARADR